MMVFCMDCLHHTKIRDGIIKQFSSRIPRSNTEFTRKNFFLINQFNKHLFSFLGKIGNCHDQGLSRSTCEWSESSTST